MRQFNRKHDVIFWYSKGDKWTFNRDAVRIPYKDPKQRPRKVFDTGGAFEKEAIDAMRARGKAPNSRRPRVGSTWPLVSDRVR